MVLSRDRFGTSAATIGPGEVEPRCGGDIEPGSAGVSAAAERLLSAERQAGSAASPLARTPRRQSRRQSPLHLGSTSAPSRLQASAPAIDAAGALIRQFLYVVVGYASRTSLPAALTIPSPFLTS